METKLGRKLRKGKELESGIKWVVLCRQAGHGRDSEEVTFDPSSTRKSGLCPIEGQSQGRLESG